MGETKICSRCREDKSLDEFSRNKNARDGRQGYCKPCAREKQAEYYHANREREIERAKAWNREHPERYQANVERWRAENRDRYLESRRANYQKHRPEILTRAKAYREANPEKVAANTARWRAANPERVNRNKANWAKSHPEYSREFSRLKASRRRAMKRATAIGRFSVEQLSARLAYYGGRCWICGAPWEHWDHVKPLSRGGAHMLANLRPACAECNLRKGARWPYVRDD